jgi:hypothetical protein
MRLSSLCPPRTAGIARYTRPLAALAAAGFGCTSVTELCACTYPPTAALEVTGSVFRAGVPAPGVVVREQTYAEACQPTDTPGVPATLNVMAPSGQADAAGRYRLVIRAFEQPASVCVRLTAYAAPTLSGSGPAVALAQVERAGLRLRDSKVGGAPLDTFRVDLTIP